MYCVGKVSREQIAAIAEVSRALYVRSRARRARTARRSHRGAARALPAPGARAAATAAQVRDTYP